MKIHHETLSSSNSTHGGCSELGPLKRPWLTLLAKLGCSQEALEAKYVCVCLLCCQAYVGISLKAFSPGERLESQRRCDCGGDLVKYAQMEPPPLGVVERLRQQIVAASATH